ncbi:MAG TPA: hypothetical protein VLM37_03325 [Fibrobacteraceae bacterium]|nr:hypothetical protein [Fibrobacteraceae bacterium]
MVTRPYFWTAAGGIPYRLEKNGEVIQEGKVPAHFRVVSIFWPPYALIYWPMGFGGDRNYDLTTASDATTPAVEDAPAEPASDSEGIGSINE